MSTLGTNTSGPLITTIDKAKEVRPEYTATAATNTVSIIALVRTASPISREYLACAAYLKWLCWFSVSHHSTPQLMLGILLLLLLLLLLSCFGLFVNADIGSIFGQDGYVFVFFCVVAVLVVVCTTHSDRTQDAKAYEHGTREK